ncbi:hypothetical protein GF327_02270 [Candidatus Woesearchaeota archaeon]|nr:hypothetical protein [Candidatus Woesearchaeota archaeon]
MISLGLTITLVFILMIGEWIETDAKQKKRIIMEDYSYYLQNEFILASEAKNGYMREFLIDNDIENIYFDIRNTNRVIIINYSQGDIAKLIPNTTGSIQKGINVIRKVNQTVCINC